jgi:hypothetical protein
MPGKSRLQCNEACLPVDAEIKATGKSPSKPPAEEGYDFAVYGISAHTVYLPDGTELEAHSGRGGRLDDPRYVHEHMRGATPT